MDRLRETAVGITVWYAFLALLGTLLLIILNDSDPHTAFLAAADVALLFALGLVVKSRNLDEHSIERHEFWRALPAHQRPRGQGGRRIARTTLELTWLQFAKGAAAVAIILCALAYTSHGPSTSASAEPSLPPPMDQPD
jgi:hypothetical protein